MKMDEIQKAHQARPFRPFAIHMADGRVLTIPHNEFLAYNPEGDSLVAYQPGDSFSVLDLALITELEMLPASGKSKGRGKKGRR